MSLQNNRKYTRVIIIEISFDAAVNNSIIIIHTIIYYFQVHVEIAVYLNIILYDFFVMVGDQSEKIMTYTNDNSCY